MGTLASAIAQLENVNPVYNNPGAISGTGDTGSSFGAGIGVYSTLEAGQSALNAQLSKIYGGTSKYYTPDMTLDEFGQVYAPKQDYGAKLASILKVPSSTKVSNIPSGVPASSTGSKGLDYYIGVLQGIAGGAAATVGLPNPATNTNTKIFGVSLEDIAVIIVGLILIGAGLFSFKGAQVIIEQGTRAAKKASEVAAL